MQNSPLQTVPHLSKREKEIVICIAWGLLSKEVAYYLSLSVRTVEKHRASIQQKIGLNKIGGNVTALMTLWAIKNGIISVPRLPPQENKAAA